MELFQQLDEGELSQRLMETLQAPPLATPADHRGPPATQMHHLELLPSQRVAALAAMQRAVSEGLTTSGTARRGLGGFIAAWQEYAEYPGVTAVSGEVGDVCTKS